MFDDIGTATMSTRTLELDPGKHIQSLTLSICVVLAARAELPNLREVEYHEYDDVRDPV